MSAETVQAYASIEGLVPAPIGLPILFLEIRGEQRSVHACSHGLAAYDDEVPGVTSS